MSALAMPLTAEAPQVWQRLAGPQKAVVAGAAAVCAALLIVFAMWSQQPDYAAAFTGLGQQDAAAMVEKLKERKLPYQLSNGGTTVLVPSAQVYDVRLQLASDGLPRGSGVGFELFDKSSLGMPEFTQRLNYQRALEGELARTIGQLSAVEASRVHLVLPKERLFVDQQKEATASVVLKLKPGAQVDNKQVAGVRHLVASAVEGLKPEHISILDVGGRLLADASTAAGSSGVAPERLDLQKSFELGLERSVGAMLEGALGPGKAAVRVNAVLNWDQWEANSETFSPPDKPAQARSTHTVEETSRGQLGAAVGGPPGVDANVPTYQAREGQATSGAEYARRETVTNYELSKVVERRVKAPGSLERLSVAVMLDQSVDPQQTQAVRDLVVAAAGINPGRGDTVTVANLPFDRSHLAVEQEAMEQVWQRQLLAEGTKVGPAVLGLLVLLLIAGRITRRIDSRTVVTEVGEAWRPLQAAAAAAPALATAAAAAGALPLSEEQQQRHDARQRVTNLARTKPTLLAEVIEGWMVEERKD